MPGFDIAKPPFVRDSRGDDLVELRREGASVLVVPRHHPTLVRTADQKNARSGKREVVRFVVPPRKGEANRFSTSLVIPSDGDVRHAPEYANIRHRVVRSVEGGLQVTDMQSLPEREFTKVLKDGKYEAAHYTDDTCDGALVAVVGGLAGVGNLAAYSLVSAPDFFPLADVRADGRDGAGDRWRAPIVEAEPRSRSQEAVLELSARLGLELLRARVGRLARRRRRRDVLRGLRSRKPVSRRREAVCRPEFVLARGGSGCVTHVSRRLEPDGHPAHGRRIGLPPRSPARARWPRGQPTRLGR